MKGLGIDLCEVNRVERSMQKSDAFLRRFFTEDERAYIASRGAMGPQSAAAMFAAKEAFLKAIGAGIGGGIELTEVAVTHAESGAPGYALTGGALAAMERIGARGAWLSLSHEAGVAAAVCVLE